MRKYIALFMVLILVFAVVVPSQQEADAAVPVLVAGGVGAAAYVYAVGALALAYGVSQIDEEMAQSISDHAQSTFATLNSAAKEAWEATVSAWDWTKTNALTISDEMLSHIGAEFAHVANYTQYQLRANTAYYDGTMGWPTHYEDFEDGNDFIFTNEPGAWGSESYIPVGTILSQPMSVRIDLDMVYSDSIREIKVYINHGSEQTSEYLRPEIYGFASYPDRTFIVDDFFNTVHMSRVIIDAVSLHLREHTLPPLALPRGLTLNVPPMQQVQEGDQVKFRVPPLVWDGQYVRDGDTDLPVLDTANPTVAPQTGTGGETETGLLSGIKDAINAILEFLQGILQQILDAIGAIPGAIIEWLQAIIEAIQSMAASLGGLLQGVLDGVLALPAQLTAIKDAILGLVSSMVTAFVNAVVGDMSKVQWRDLEMVASTITYKFPFSLPWDVGRSFDAVFGDLSRATDFPVFTIQFDWLGHGYQWDLTFPRLILDWLPFFRAITLIIFDIALVFAVRKVLGGAS